jgi:hypothetical protein
MFKMKAAPLARVASLNQAASLIQIVNADQCGDDRCGVRDASVTPAMRRNPIAHFVCMTPNSGALQQIRIHHSLEPDSTHVGSCGLAL